GSRGVVYLAGVDAKGLWVARSSDAGKTFAVKQGVAPLPGNRAATCLVFGKFVLPQQAVRCLGPNPTLSLGRNRVFVTYGVNGAVRGRAGAGAASDRAWGAVGRGRVGWVQKRGDQFGPPSTVAASPGRLGPCYYDTPGAPARQPGWFVCSSSPDGRHWSEP